MLYVWMITGLIIYEHFAINSDFEGLISIHFLLVKNVHYGMLGPSYHPQALKISFCTNGTFNCSCFSFI